jgi:hypothetical protein
VENNNPGSGHEELRKILKRARRVAGRASPEAREANLRKLIRASLETPEVPDTLRARVQAIEAARRRRRRTWAVRAFITLCEFVTGRRTLEDPAQPSVRLGARRPAWLASRKLLIGLAPLALAVMLLFLFLILNTNSPVQALARSVDAMARVRSVHCTGQYMRYPPATWDRSRPWPRGPQKVEWWYKAPNRFRYQVEPELEAWPEAGTGIIIGQRRAFVGDATSRRRAEQGVSHRIQITEPFLTPFDFISPERMIAGRKINVDGGNMTATIARWRGKPYNRPIDLIVVVSEVPVKYGVHGPWSTFQLLDVDPHSHLLLRSRRNVFIKEGDHWRAVEKETLDHFEYNVDLADSLFQSEPPGS